MWFIIFTSAVGIKLPAMLTGSEGQHFPFASSKPQSWLIQLRWKEQTGSLKATLLHTKCTVYSSMPKLIKVSHHQFKMMKSWRRITHVTYKIMLVPKQLTPSGRQLLSRTKKTHWNVVIQKQLVSCFPPFLFFPHLYWGIIASQWCVSFWFITKWISYTYTYIPISLPSCVFFPPAIPIPPL